MLKDDGSDYKGLFEFSGTSSKNVSREIIDCTAAFGVPSGLMSDSPRHFKNETVRLDSTGLRLRDHFTLPYLPWNNGAVERLGKEILHVFCSVASAL